MVYCLERDELHKDIEQLCMQQAGPSYIGVPTRPLHRYNYFLFWVVGGGS